MNDQLRAYTKKKTLHADNRNEHLSFEQLIDYVDIKESTKVSMGSGVIDTATDFSSDHVQQNNDQSRTRTFSFKPRYKPWRQDQRYDNNWLPQQNNAQQPNLNQGSQQSQPPNSYNQGLNYSNQDADRAQHVSFQQQYQQQCT